MYLFKNSSDKWIFGATIYSECPAGSYKMEPNSAGTKVSISTLERGVSLVFEKPISFFKKGNGTAYSSLSELIAACDGFFQAAGSGATASTIDGGSASTVF